MGKKKAKVIVVSRVQPKEPLKITDEIRQKLREPLPTESITQHPTKSYLSTIKAIYITERLNDVFGIGRWLVDHKVISDKDDYVLMFTFE